MFIHSQRAGKSAYGERASVPHTECSTAFMVETLAGRGSSCAERVIHRPLPDRVHHSWRFLGSIRPRRERGIASSTFPDSDIDHPFLSSGGKLRRLRIHV